MKRHLILKGVLAGILALGVFASCKAEMEDGEEKSVVETNELAGKKFAADFDNEMSSIDFSDDTFLLSSEYAGETIKYCGEYCIREEEKYSYSLNSEIDYFLSKKLDFKKSYVRDGITLYTEPNTIPETFEEYKAEKIKLYKALNPSITEAQVEELLNEDLICSVESFNNWRKWQVLYKEAKKKIYYTYAYKLESNKLVLCDEDWAFIPQGLKFGDIFNGSYDLWYPSSYTSEFYNPDFEIEVFVGTMIKNSPNITIRENNDETEYTILSATNDSMAIAKVTGRKDGYIEFDESKAFTTPITYTNGENKVTATITIEGKEYSFDIEYVTKEEINKVLEEDSVEYTLQ